MKAGPFATSATTAQDHVHIVRRPSSAPSGGRKSAAATAASSVHVPSFNTTFKHLKFVTTAEDASSPRDTARSARSTDTGHHTYASTAATEQDRAMRKKFVYSGRSYRMPIDPLNQNLRELYRFRGKNIATTHEEYGLFVKNLSRAIKSRTDLYNKQKVLKHQLQTLHM